MQNEDFDVSIIDLKSETSANDEKKKLVNDEVPQNQPFLSYLDSKSPNEIQEAINYFSKNLRVIDDNIINKLFAFLTDDLCTPLLLATLGNAILINNSLLDAIHYNAIQSYILEYFSNISDEYPFFRLPHLACPAIDFITKYISIDQNHVRIILDEGILDTINHILTTFQEQPDGSENIQFHADVLCSTFKLLQNLFKYPFLLPTDNDVISTLELCIKCIENICTENELIHLSKTYKEIVKNVIAGCHQRTQIIMPLLSEHIEFLRRLIKDEHYDLQIDGLSLILNFSAVDDDTVCEHLINDGFLDIFANMSQNSSGDHLLLMLKIICNFSCCSDTMEFKKALGEENIVQFYFSCLRGHSLCITVIALKILNNLYDSGIISLTSTIIENEELLELITDLFQTNDMAIIQQASITLARAIAQLELEENDKYEFIEKLICEYNLDSEIEEYLQTIENHAKITENAPEIYVLQGELLRYLSNKNEQNDAIISYQVQNSDNENDEN